MKKYKRELRKKEEYSKNIKKNLKVFFFFLNTHMKEIMGNNKGI